MGETDKHEVLAISLETDTVAVGICCFLSDREIEFYWEKFPECCVKNRDGDDHVARNMMAAVSHWATKWTLAEAVNFLVRSRDLVVLVSKGTTRQWRQIAQYEKRHSFNFFIQSAPWRKLKYSKVPEWPALAKFSNCNPVIT